MSEHNDLARETTQRFIHLYRHFRRYGRKMQKAGIRGRDFAMLRYLVDAGPAKIGQIQQYMYISYSTTSEMISRMEDAGYVKRTRCKKDNRVVFVNLTGTGRALAEETPLGGIPLLREKIKTLPPERLIVVNEALIELQNLMEIETG